MTMTPEEFFESMTGPSCLVTGLLTHRDFPDLPLEIDFPDLATFLIFVTGAPAFAKRVGHDGKVTLTIRCACSKEELMELPL
jgi:hypothetical protein